MPGAERALAVVSGNTSTDAVGVDAHGRLLIKAKVATTPDALRGIEAAARRVLADPQVETARIGRLVLGTWHGAEVAQERGRADVAVIRIGSPLTLAVPPLATWPRGLRDAVSVGEVVVAGGGEQDGRASGPLDEDAVARFLQEVAGRAGAVAITGVFSPVRCDDELAAAAVVRRELGGAVAVSLSHEIGTLGLLERENATVLNAALTRSAEDHATAVIRVMRRLGIVADVFFTQNDGSLMAAPHAVRLPVLTVRAGPGNAMRGAAQLSGADEAVVVDVGGRHTHVGALVDGFPRESFQPTRIAGVPMGFRTPEARLLPVGGDTVAHHETTPDVFRRLLADAVDRARGARRSVALVAVGGAAGLVPDDLEGVSVVVRPPDADVAGAIGAAVAPAGGQADRICPDRADRRRAALREAREAALGRAIHAGADPEAVQVVDVEELPLWHPTDPAVRIRVKAAGPVA